MTAPALAQQGWGRTLDLFRGVRQDMLLADPVDVTRRLTLLYLLFKPQATEGIRFVLLTLAALGLLSARARQAAVFWLALAGLSALKLELPSDNHHFLLVYWNLLLALTVGPDRQAVQRSLALHARLLLGSVFLLAVTWKLILSPDFLDGRFFVGTFHFDDRFYDFAVAMSDASPTSITAGRVLRRELMSGSLPYTSAVLDGSDTVWHVSLAATFWTAIMETAVAIAFLAPTRSLLSVARHDLLLYFIACTYAVAPVAGFGWLLLIMGYAQLPSGERVRRLLYLLSFVIVLAYQLMPVSGLVRDLAGGDAHEQADGLEPGSAARSVHAAGDDAAASHHWETRPWR